MFVRSKILRQREFFWNFGLKIGQRSLNTHNSYILTRETFPLLASIFPEEKILMQKVTLVYISSLRCPTQSLPFTITENEKIYLCTPSLSLDYTAEGIIRLPLYTLYRYFTTGNCKPFPLQPFKIIKKRKLSLPYTVYTLYHQRE